MAGDPLPRCLFGLALSLLCCLPLAAATRAATDRFLHDLRHAWVPYPLPAETGMAEIERVAAMGFDTVGLSFAGPYDGGKLDFAKLEEAITIVDRRHARAVLHLLPRFAEADGVGDTLDNGRVVPSLWNRNPNYAMVDIFDPRQRQLYADWLRLAAERYGRDPRVAAFLVGWGYMGETGFYMGDFLEKWGDQGAECAGYSPAALRELNRWRAAKARGEGAPHPGPLPKGEGEGWAALESLPRPSPGRQSDDYIQFMRFRSEFVSEVFQRELVAAVQRHTDRPVGLFAYLPASPDSYCRNWSPTPGADFYRSAGSAASYDLGRTLVDSGVGWEDSALHDGGWGFTAACMQRDEVRMMALGGEFHAMWVRVYETEPPWEPGVFDKVAAWLRTEQVHRQLRRPAPTIALYQPTWGTAAIPGRSPQQPFLPRADYSEHLTKMVGLVESFGLPYRLITERDLNRPETLARYRHLIIPMWDLMHRVLDRPAFLALARDPRVIRLPLQHERLTRSALRARLQHAGIRPQLDCDGEGILAGRIGNLVYNWGKEPITVRVPERKGALTLQGYEWKVL